MKARFIASLATSAVLAANAFDQPEVKFFVVLNSGGSLVDCPIMEGSLGDSMEVVLRNNMRVAAYASPMDSDGRSAINLKFYSSLGLLAHQFNYSAKLTQQKPMFEYRVADQDPAAWLTVHVESASLLATDRNRPSWREFDTRMRPDSVLERTKSQRDCVPL